MKIRSKAIVAGIAGAYIAFMGCSSALAMGDPQGQGASSIMEQTRGVPIHSKLGTSVRIGTIMSMNTSQMVLIRQHNGKTEQLNFVLNSETVRRGEIAVGSRVTVHYRNENNQHIATSIQTRNVSPESL